MIARAHERVEFRDGSTMGLQPIVTSSTDMFWYLCKLFKRFCQIDPYLVIDCNNISIYFALIMLLYINSLILMQTFIQRNMEGETRLGVVVAMGYMRAKTAFFQSTLGLVFLDYIVHIALLRILDHNGADQMTHTAGKRIFSGVGGPGKLRGSLWFVLGVVSLVLFDNDSKAPLEHPEGAQHHGVRHVLYYLLAWTGLSDHEGGIIVLLVTLCLQAYLNNGGRRLAVDVGGAKRLHALTSIVSTAILAPVAAIIWITHGTSGPGALQYLPQAFVVAFFVFTLDYYIETACIQRLDVIRTSRLGTLSIFLTSLVVNSLWSNATRETTDSNDANINTEHAASGGLIFSFIMFAAATVQLTTSKERGRLSALEFGGGTLPLHGLPGEALQRSQSVVMFLVDSLRQVLNDKNSRIIFYFLCVNLSFTCVEFLYGFWTNSLGLISDGFHMLFDCSALVMGLVASVMAKWKPTKTFPFGYGRIEVLSGFVNGLFLTVVGLMVLYEALWRLYEPPVVQTERLLTVAVGGLIVNLFGIVSFSHSHGHGHSHANHVHDTPGCSDKAKLKHGHSHNTNMQGVYLHIVADTMGSIAVIISSLLIDWYGWLIADPICSTILALLILLSVLPLLKESAAILVLHTPVDVQSLVLNKILEVENVVSCPSPRFWQHSGEVFVAAVKVQCVGDVAEQRIIHRVQGILQEAGFNQNTVEVEQVSSAEVVIAEPSSQWGLGTIIHSQSEIHSIRAV
ncbi:unnamed protein product, partial [Meganyctiphanes norvegica]